jgi:uncharacterized BrkB/YihY/UPF0761 family membrane protein
MRRLASLCAATLLPLAAHASFSGGGPCPDFACYFIFIGGLAGAAGGVPGSAAIFACLHIFFSHPQRSQRKQILLGALFGAIAFEVFAVAASLVLLWEQAHPGHPRWLIAAGPVALYLLMAAASVRYARSAPRKGGQI